MLQKLLKFWRSTESVRARFGLVTGLRFASDLRQEWLAPPGSLVALAIPGLSHPMYCRAGTSDFSVIHQIFVDDELGFDLPHAPTTIVDAGANIGAASIRFAQRWPQARIHAIELDASNFGLLQRNVAPYPQITAHHAALWGHEGHVAIENPGTAPWALRARGSAADEDGSVRALTLDALQREQSLPRIDLLKVDIEGGEREVFAGSTDWLDAVDTIAIELHPRLAPECAEVFEEAMRGRVHHRFMHGEYHVCALRPRGVGAPVSSHSSHVAP